MNQKKTILIVEDEEDTALCLKDRLEMEEYEVQTAADGQQGLEKAVTVKPQLILLDVMMPKMNGFQVCRELRKNGEKEIPIIMISAKAQQSDKFWGMETGASDYITKPFEMEELITKIRGYLK